MEVTYSNFGTIWMDLACIHEIALQQLKSQYWIQLNSSWQRNCQKPSTKGKSTRDMKVKLVLIVENSSAPVNWGNMRRCIIKWDIEMNIKFHKSVVKLMYAKETESEPSWLKWNWSIFLKMQVKSWPISSTKGVEIFRSIMMRREFMNADESKSRTYWWKWKSTIMMKVKVKYIDESESETLPSSNTEGV